MISIINLIDKAGLPTNKGRGKANLVTEGVKLTNTVELVVKGTVLEYQRIITILTFIDLSNNKFKGEIPSVIGMLNSLRHLNLSHNDLRGQIPTMLENLTTLESLDLSSNQLKGKIPSQLVQLTFLAVFNVSKNQLSGRIPLGAQFNNFANDSYQGNPALCGSPLTTKCEGIVVHSVPTSLAEEDSSGFFNGFTWQSVVLGYGCGLVLGVGIGCLMFFTGKPKWVLKIVEKQPRRRQNQKCRKKLESENVRGEETDSYVFSGWW